MADAWYLKDSSGSISGPLSEKQISKELLAGQVPSTSLVRQNEGPWASADHVREIFARLRETGWYLKSGHEVFGPFVEPRIRQLHASGEIADHAEIRQGNQGAWRPFAQWLSPAQSPAAQSPSQSSVQSSPAQSVAEQPPKLPAANSLPPTAALQQETDRALLGHQQANPAIVHEAASTVATNVSFAQAPISRDDPISHRVVILEKEIPPLPLIQVSAADDPRPDVAASCSPWERLRLERVGDAAIAISRTDGTRLGQLSEADGERCLRLAAQGRRFAALSAPRQSDGSLTSIVLVDVASGVLADNCVRYIRSLIARFDASQAGVMPT